MVELTVAAAQAAPVFLDLEATLVKLEKLARDAADRGVDLLVFPESFVPAYPDWVWRSKPWDGPSGALYARLVESAVVAPGPVTERIGELARELSIWLVVGVTERAGSTLYNTLLWFGPDGALALRHRKLMPTGGERLVWGTATGRRCACSTRTSDGSVA